MRRIKARVIRNIGTEAQWLQKNPILGDGEIALVRFGGRVRNKVGDGSLTFSSLGYQDNDLKISEATPSFPFISGEGPAPAGIYMANGSGTYNGNLQVDTSGKLVMLIWDGIGTLKKVETPMPLPESSNDIIKNGILPASTGGVYTEFQNFQKGISRIFPQITQSSYLNNDGIVVTGITTQFVTTEPIAVENGDIVIYGGKTNAGSNTARALWGFKIDGTPIKMYLATIDASIEKISIPILENEVDYVIACFLGTSEYFIGKKSRLIDREAIIGLDLMDSEIESLKSFLYDKQKLVFNIFPAFVDSSGESINIGTWFSSDFIKITHGVKYYFQGRTNAGGGTAYAITGYNSSKERISSVLHTYDSVTSGLYEFIITDLNLEFIKICSYKDVELNLFIQSTGEIPKEKVEGLTGIAEDVELLKLTSNGDGKINADVTWASIGDSITLYDSQLGKKGYQSWIMEVIRFISHTNFGFSGQSLTSASDRTSIVESTINIGTYGLYTILVGTNDFKLNRPIGTVDDYLNNTGANTFYGAYRILIDRIFGKNQSANVMLMTPLRRDTEGYATFDVNTAGHTLNDYCEAIRWIAKREALKLCDLYKYSGMTERNIFLLAPDGLHPHDEGNRIIAKPMIISLTEIFK